MLGRLGWTLLVAAAGCAHRDAPAPGPVLPFAFEARPTAGEIRVVEVIPLHPTPTVDLDDWLGPALPDARVRVRTERTGQLAALAGEVGRALPGEVNGALGDQWPGQFRGHRLPGAARHQLEDALRGGRALDPTLAAAARAVGGDAVLFSWVDLVQASPLSTLGPPGEILETDAGPALVDHADEAYLVSARVGLALVTADGEVVLRYQDTYEAVLSGAGGPRAAGRDLAQALAEEVARVWAVDPRLREAEPEAREVRHRPPVRPEPRALR